MHSQFHTLEWIGGVDGHLRLIDQTRLPMETVYLDCRTAEDVWQAIKRLAVRGAPAIGVAAAYGVCVGVNEGRTVDEVCDYLATSRPTAVNLFWALERMRRVTQQGNEPSPNPSLQGREKEGRGPLVIESCTIVTTSANRMMSEMHERMPVILAPNDYATWLDPSVEDPQSLIPLLSACGEDELTAEPIGTYVNKVANDGPECIAVQRSLF